MSLLPSQRILITGAGIVSPLGLDWQENEAAFRTGRTAFRPVTMFDVSQRIAKTAAHVDLPEERLFHKLPRRREQLIDRGTKMLLLALREALAMAKLPDLQGVDALIIGTSAGAMGIGQEYFRHAVSSPARVAGQLSRIEHYQPQRQLNAIAEEYGWYGPMIIVSNACASGANAIGDAMAMIQTGKAQRVLAGGYDALAELVYAGFDTLRALAPSGIPRPFDAARDGLALGEGAAMILLESEAAAAQRGATAIAEAAGYAIATDLHHLTQPDPEGKAAIRSMTGACQMARITPGEVSYINSHGTGTPYNDVAEASAVRAWAGTEVAAGIPLSSTKSAMGHLLGGAGAVEAVICLMTLRGQWLPGSLGIREIDPAVSFDLVQSFREAPVQVALTNSFGFGGTNATLVLKAIKAPHGTTKFDVQSSMFDVHARQGSEGRTSNPEHRTSKAELCILGVGAVSAAGWGAPALLEAVSEQRELPTTDCPRSLGSRDWSCRVRLAPAAPSEALPKFPRLRRASPITKFAMGAALEALGQAGYPLGVGVGRLGIVQLMFNGCVQFSGKFYHEVMATPALASPLIFPETVYNAPASHIAAFLGVDGPVTTLLGESTSLMEGVSIAHTWLVQGLVDRVLVIGAEECDWVSAEAASYYHPEMIAAEGAGALLLALGSAGLKLTHTAALPYHHVAERAGRLRELGQDPFFTAAPLHISGQTGIPLLDQGRDDGSANGAPRVEGSGHRLREELHPHRLLGESMGAASAFQLVLAASLAQQRQSPVAVTLPGTLCAAYGVLIAPSSSEV